MALKYSKQDIEEAVKASRTNVEVLRRLGCHTVTGGMYSYIRSRFRHFGIDTTHFLGSRSTTGMKFGPHHSRRNWEQVLVKHQRSHRTYSALLRRALLDSGVTHVCECGQGPTWLGKKLVLQVDHVNGDWRDDRRSNLRFLCPNCHSQTATRGKSIKEPRKRPKVSSKITWPPDKQLIRWLMERPATLIAKELGVSDRAVIRHCERRNLDIPRGKGRWMKTRAA